jgi:multiple sugar transport system permease protein
MATLTLTSIWTFNSFDIIWTATKGGPLHASETLPIFTYLQAFTFKNYGNAAAVSVLSFLIVILVCFPYIRAMARRLKDGS